MMSLGAAEIRQRALALGFDQVGLIPAAPPPRLDAYLRWIAAGQHGEMGYLARPDRQARRQDLNVILPGVRSLIVVALDYAVLAPSEDTLRDPRRGRIARYAWGADYHELMAARLQTLADALRAAGGADVISRVYVDTGALLERSHAQQAGLGFIGKNTLLIHPQRGSYLFLGEILTTQPLDAYDAPHAETMCGRCTRCLSACPAAAFPQPYVLDARRCISYLTIELKGSVPEDLRPLLGNWVFGCDVCQEVCPFTRKFTQPSAEPAFWPADLDRAAPPLAALLALDEGSFRERFAGTPLARTGRDRLVRNACIAAGNSGLREFGPRLEQLAAADRSELVREHAAWARARIVSWP